MLSISQQHGYHTMLLWYGKTEIIKYFCINNLLLRMLYLTKEKPCLVKCGAFRFKINL